MDFRVTKRRTSIWALTSLAVGWAACGASAGPPDFAGQWPWNHALAAFIAEPPVTFPHEHEPVDMDARPIIARVPVTLTRPRRVLWEADGSVIVADWGAGTVLRVSDEGTTTILATDLHEPAGLARDAAGDLYVANHAAGIAGAGTIVKLSPGGMPMLFADGLNGPTGLAFDADGVLHVADFHGDRIVQITPDGAVRTFIDDLPTPAALVFDPQGYLYTVSSTEGTVYRISPMGDVIVVIRGLLIPSDLAFDPQGHLIVANYGGAELTYVDLKGKARTFATVPKGTIGLGFDTDGNVIFVNWDYQSLMKITLQLHVPCPHCGKSIPVRLRPRRQPPPPSRQTTGPVI